MRSKLIALLFFACSAAMAVTVFRVDPAPVMTTAGVAPVGGYPALYAVAGATVNVCQDAACATPQTTYTDATGANTCPIGAPVVLAGTSTCTSTTGPQGQFGFWLPLNNVGTSFYYKVIFGNGQTFGPFPVTSAVAGVVSLGVSDPIQNTGTSSNPVIVFNPLTGDCTTSGHIITCPGNNKPTGLNGGAAPTSQNCLSTNGSGQLVACTEQGNGSKVQMASGAAVPGNVPFYDSNGNLINSGATPLPSPGSPLQYLRMSANPSATIPQYAALPVVNVSDYNFPGQSPGGSLSSGVTNTVTLTPCPLGVNFGDTNHYLYVSGGTGTPEAVLINGGSCTSGLSTGTVQFIPANNHSGAWSISSASAGITEAVNSLPSTGGTITFPPSASPYSIYAPIIITKSHVILQGAGADTEHNAGSPNPATSISWAGAGTGPMIQFATIAGSANQVYTHGGIRDLAVFCNGTATIGVSLQSVYLTVVRNATISECTTADLDFSLVAGSIESGGVVVANANKNVLVENVSLLNYQTSGGQNGIPLRLAGGSATADTGFCTFFNIRIVHYNAPGISILYADSNHFEQIGLSHPAGSATAGILLDASGSGALVCCNTFININPGQKGFVQQNGATSSTIFGYQLQNNAKYPPTVTSGFVDFVTTGAGGGSFYNNSMWNIGTLNSGTTNIAFELASATNTATLSASSQMVQVKLVSVPTSAASYTTDSAANICAAMNRPIGGNGSNFSPAVDWWVDNFSGGSNTITILAGSGVTFSNTDVSIPQNNIRHYKIMAQNCVAGSEAVQIVSLEGGTH